MLLLQAGCHHARNLSIHRPICQYLPVYLLYQPIDLHAYLPAYVPIYLSNILSVCLPMHLSTYCSISLYRLGLPWFCSLACVPSISRKFNFGSFQFHYPHSLLHSLQPLYSLLSLHASHWTILSSIHSFAHESLSHSIRPSIHEPFVMQMPTDIWLRNAENLSWSTTTNQYMHMCVYIYTCIYVHTYLSISRYIYIYTYYHDCIST